MAHFYNPPPPLVGDAAGFPSPYDLPYIHHPPSDSAAHLTPEQQKIHTLFVSGLPDDVKPREIHNLFRRRPGFESCQLKYTGRGDQVVAFATFFNHPSAMATMSALNGVIFDPQTGATLHIELARSNSRTKHPIGGGVYTVIDKRTKLANDDQESMNGGDNGSDEPSGTNFDNASNKGGLSALSSGDAATDADSSPASTKICKIKNEENLMFHRSPT
ncbi:hypothetical protein Taro_012901 [Colocasia esculenta]|uniref:RRM domain-containing protein n=1 Tax=Colocasia esculenta TaxID=4460 RepID=A0A843U569_COLES|nr:hypothetical protein [Colocasia esculenta]